MKVVEYATLPEAQPHLQKVYHQNTLAVSRVSERYKTLLLHANRRENRKENISNIVNQAAAAMSQLGRGEEITILLKLYNCSSGYVVEAHYITPKPLAFAGFFSNAQDLVEGSRNLIQQSPASPYGITISPFFYTVAEPSRFSPEEREDLRRKYNYESLSPKDQKDMDIVLEAYIEYGLGAEERQEFERGYARFFN